MSIINRGITLLSEANESLSERGECKICLCGFTEGGPSSIDSAVNCGSCKSAFHGKCAAEYWWRHNVRRALRSFAGSSGTCEEFYFDIGAELGPLTQKVALWTQKLTEMEAVCSRSEAHLRCLRNEQQQLLQASSTGNVLSAVSKQRLAELEA